MAGRSPQSSCKLQSLVTLLHSRHKATSGGGSFCRLPPYNLGCGVCASEGLRFISASSSCSSRFNQPKDEIQVHPPLLPAPLKSGFSHWRLNLGWVKWLLGSLASLLLPFWKNKWDNLRRLEGKAEKVVEEVEVVAEVVEQVSTAADKALEEVATQLADNTRLKDAAQAMEHVSQVVARDAHLLQNIIHKVGDVKNDVEELETMVGPIFNDGPTHTH